MKEHRIRLVTPDGHDYPAWIVGNCMVFQVSPEQAEEGRQWFTYDRFTGQLAECATRAEAIAFAHLWAVKVERELSP